ncbi:MAG: hypothetical protein HC896_02110 [Bacteroidales bacterium]|nr:hypothetical protein [Bacteroidales bacterium]
MALKDMGEYQVKSLQKEPNLMVFVSTHGEGDPPFAAEELHEFVHSKRAPKLQGVKFAVCSLGDSSYLHFCKTGKDFDMKFEELGGVRFCDRADFDLDFEEVADEWINQALTKFGSLNGHATHQVTIADKKTEAKAIIAYDKKNPFKANVLDKVLLNGRGSSKETLHVELSLEESGLSYEPGDALGIFSSNSDRLVEEVLEVTGFDKSVNINHNNSTVSIVDALKNHYELTLLNREVLARYAKFAESAELNSLLSDSARLKEYLYGRDVADMVKEFPVKLDPQQFVDLLRKLPPRLYSISSSLNANPNEVHLTVGVVRYHQDGRKKEGVCSTFCRIA